MGQGDKLAACPTELAYDPSTAARCELRSKLARREDLAEQKRLSAGGGDPFSHRGRKDPRQSRGVISGPSTLSGTGRGTGTGSSGMTRRRSPIAFQPSRRTHPRRCARWDKWTRRDNKKWSRRDGTLTFDIRGAPESGPTARWGVGLR